MGSRQGHSREQQGLSLGHWLLALQDWAAHAVADKANKDVTKRTIVSDYVRGWIFVGICGEELKMYNKAFNSTTDKRASCGN